MSPSESKIAIPCGPRRVAIFSLAWGVCLLLVLSLSNVAKAQAPPPGTDSGSSNKAPDSSAAKQSTPKQKTAADYYEEGEEAFAGGEFQLSKKLFNEALKLDPNHVDALYKLGVTYQQLRQFGQAWNYIRKANQTDPEHKKALTAFLLLWKGFERKQVLDVGQSPYKVTSTLGQPDDEISQGSRRRLSYNFMTIDFVNNRLFSILDTRNFSREKAVALAKVDFSFDNRKWKPIHRTVSNEQVIVESIPEGQSPRRMIEIIKNQRAIGLRHRGVTAQRYAAMVQAAIRRQSPTLQWNVVDAGTNDLLVEWSIVETDDRGNKRGVHSLARAFGGEKDIHFLTYQKAGDRMDDTQRMLWIDRLRSAKLTPIQKKPAG